VLLPGVLAYMQAKQAGASDTQALLTALMSLRRGANSTAGSGQGYGSQGGSDTSGKIDPGAAGTASWLEGLFGALLNGALHQGQGGQTPAQPTPPAQRPAAPSQPGGDITDLLGQLFGQQGREWEMPHRM